MSYCARFVHYADRWYFYAGSSSSFGSRGLAVTTGGRLHTAGASVLAGDYHAGACRHIWLPWIGVTRRAWRYR